MRMMETGWENQAVRWMYDEAMTGMRTGASKDLSVIDDEDGERAYNKVMVQDLVASKPDSVVKTGTQVRLTGP